MINLSFKSIPHALATFYKRVVADTPKIIAGAEKVLDKAASEKTAVEGVSGAVANAITPGAGVAVVTIEDAAFSLLGCVDALLKSGDAAAEAKLLGAGLDVAAINNAKAVGAQSASFYTLLKSL